MLNVNVIVLFQVFEDGIGSEESRCWCGYVSVFVQVRNVFRKLHAELGHPGVSRMFEAVRKRLWWPMNIATL